MDNAMFDPLPNAGAQAQFSRAESEIVEWQIVLPVPANAPLAPFTKHNSPKNHWAYRDKNGNLLFWIYRYAQENGCKSILPYTLWQNFDGQREWRKKHVPTPRPLYNLDTLAANPDAIVVVCEGEKAADGGTELFSDVITTTSPNGAKSARQADWSPLAGRRVIVCPDNDTEGKAYAADVVNLAHAAGATSVAVVQIPESFPAKWDLADDLPEGVTTEDIAVLFRNAKQIPAPSAVYENKWQSGYDADQLRHMEFLPTKYVVKDYIPEGVTIFAGRPKLGKSWACLDIATAVATGGNAFGSIPCEQGEVLYLALEDNPRRLKSRMTKLFGRNIDWPSALRFETQWPRLNEGGVKKIREWIEGRANPRLVIIDTLGKVRGDQNKQDSAYQADYKAMAELQTLASEMGVAIIIVHHVRKMEADDPIDTVSGTLGLSGAADTILVLNRNTHGVTLYGRGRDIEEIETVVKFDKSACIWKIVGHMAEVKKSDERTEIINILNGDMKPMKPQEIADILEKPHTAIRQMMVRMARCGDIQKISYGLYASKDYIKEGGGGIDAHHSGHSVTEKGDGVSDSDAVTGVTGGIDDEEMEQADGT